ncbi:MAG: MarR family winged helix-turn-helix transcriptional regulator [Labrys sp. (in: a-proteobacteria)]|jgi:DNA-binding MarR family transcriptional regulator
MPPARVPPLDKALCFNLYAATHAITRVYRPLLDELGLSYPQLLVLQSLWERDGRSVRDIGERLMLDSGTLSPVIKRLQAAGLVDKSRCSEDERQVSVTLTEKGRQLQPAAQAIGGVILDRTALDQAEIDALVERLATLIDRLQDDTA